MKVRKLRVCGTCGRIIKRGGSAVADGTGVKCPKCVKEAAGAKKTGDRKRAG